MNLSPTAKAQLYRGLAKRIAALGGDMGDIDTLGCDDRSLIRLLEGMMGRIESQSEKKPAQ